MTGSLAFFTANLWAPFEEAAGRTQVICRQMSVEVVVDVGSEKGKTGC